MSDTIFMISTFRMKMPFLLFVFLVGGLQSAWAHRQIPFTQLVIELEKSGQLDVLWETLRAQIAQKIPNPEAQDAFLAPLREFAKSADASRLSRFPTIPLMNIGNLRPLLGGLGNESPPRPSSPMKGTLESLLGKCDSPRPEPVPLRPDLPLLRYGHFPDLSLSECTNDRSIKLARILTALADGESEIRYNKKRITSPADLIRALATGGHEILLSNEQTYANFLAFTWGDDYVVMPAWLDTGIRLKSGQNLLVPMGHSHQSWRINGPLFEDVRVAFYLGSSGIGFFPQVDDRPKWTGLKKLYTISSRDDLDTVVKAADLALKYYRHALIERATVAKSYPIGGYGYIGVCNDSNAYIELLTRGTTSVFPLLRASELDARGNAEILSDLRKLPKDTKADLSAPVVRSDFIRRILNMVPYDLDSEFIVDEQLRRQLKEAATEGP